jgi:ABC-type dipeptide/oligopeptide/nickel transport system permease component
VLVINTLLMLVGNILSDVLYVLVDPRIRFN